MLRLNQFLFRRFATEATTAGKSSAPQLKFAVCLKQCTEVYFLSDFEDYCASTSRLYRVIDFFLFEL